MSDLEDNLLFQIRAIGLPEPLREYKFYPGRKYRSDFAYPEYKLLIECSGGIWNCGAHGRGTGIQRDYDKYNLAALEKWHVLQFSREDIDSGSAVTVIEKFIKEFDIKNECDRGEHDK